MIMRPQSILIVTLVLLTLAPASALAMYHPRMGRFMQRDPHGTVLDPAVRVGSSRAAASGGAFLARDPYPDGMNLYTAYHILRGEHDPFGLRTCKWTVNAQ